MLASDLDEVAPQGVIDNDGSAISERLNSVGDIARYNCDYTWSGNLSNAVDGHFEFALDYFIYFFLRMEMFVNGRATREIVMRKRHARRVEIPSVPTGQAFNNAKAAGVDKWHGQSPSKKS